MSLRRTSAVLALGAMLGCTTGPEESAPDAAKAPSAQGAAPATFAGVWRSVTPTMEFIRLTVVPKSSEQGALGARLTFSGVAWDGSGRIDGDSLVADMRYGTTPSVLVARARDARTLDVRFGSFGPTPLALTFVRDD